MGELLLLWRRALLALLRGAQFLSTNVSFSKVLSFPMLARVVYTYSPSLSPSHSCYILMCWEHGPHLPIFIASYRAFDAEEAVMDRYIEGPPAMGLYSVEDQRRLSSLWTPLENRPSGSPLFPLCLHHTSASVYDYLLLPVPRATDWEATPMPRSLVFIVLLQDIGFNLIRK